MLLKQSLLIIVCGFLFFSCSSSKGWNEASTFFYNGNHAMAIEVEIEGEKHLVHVDTGAAECLSLQREIVDRIENKEYCTITTMNNFKGEYYTSPIYTVPSLKIQNLEFSNVPIREIPKHINCTIHRANDPKRRKKIDSEKAMVKGSIGVDLLTTYNLYLNPRKSIYFQLTQEEPNFIKGFHEAPFEFTDHEIIITVNTSIGPKKLLIDTGATHTVLPVEQIPSDLHETIEEHPGLKKYSTKKFVIGNHDFGDKEIYLVPFRWNVNFDGILGMDFLRRHKTYFDFKNHKVYFKRV